MAYRRNIFAQVVTVHDLGEVSGTVTCACSDTPVQQFRGVIVGDVTLANPTGLIDGMMLRWRFTHKASSKIAGYGSKFVFVGGVNSDTGAAGTVRLLSGIYDAASDRITMQPEVAGKV